jgi:hypothetical protein
MMVACHPAPHYCRLTSLEKAATRGKSMQLESKYIVTKPVGCQTKGRIIQPVQIKTEMLTTVFGDGFRA